MEADRCRYFQEQDTQRAMQDREQLAVAVAAGKYKGPPRQTALPGLK